MSTSYAFWSILFLALGPLLGLTIKAALLRGRGRR